MEVTNKTNTVVEELEVAKKPFVMNKKTIADSLANTIMVRNTKEGYGEYFRLGGTVAKMTTSSTKNYMGFKKKKYEERNMN